MSTETCDSLTVKSKPKKKSIVERELETSLTDKFTSPVPIDDKSITSRYGRSRRSKTESDFETNNAIIKSSKSPKPGDKSLNKLTSHSPVKKETPQKPHKLSLETQIENIYNENQTMSRFSSEKKGKPASIKSPKIYVRKDLIQHKEKEETITLIKNMFSPGKSPYKPSSSRSNKYPARSSEKYSWNKSHNGHLHEMSSVVKTLDFDSNRKKKRERDTKGDISKSDLFELEAKCSFQVGDLAWARIGTFPFWPCIVTRDPESGMFVKKKLFGRIERDIINVTFCNDNGRRSWVIENMLRPFKGRAEFMETRDKFTPESKKRDPRFYTAFFVSDKKQHLWNLAIDEAETLLKEPKRFRIELLNEMILKARAEKFNLKKSGKITRTDSDVSLSESLYDSLFSEEDVKDDSRDRLRNKSFDVSDVVTACLHNMAAKTGITKIKKQSHMDRWLQKAKSKTPEKNQFKVQISSKKASEIKTESTKKRPHQSRSRSSRISNRISGQSLTNHTIDNEDVSESIKNKVDSCSIVNENIENIPLVNGNDYTMEYKTENHESGSQFSRITKIESLADQTLDDSVEDQSNVDVSMITYMIDQSDSVSTEIKNDQVVDKEKDLENTGDIEQQILNNIESSDNVSDNNNKNLDVNQVGDSNIDEMIITNDTKSEIADLISDAAQSSYETKNIEEAVVVNITDQDQQNETTKSITNLFDDPSAGAAFTVNGNTNISCIASCESVEMAAVQKEIADQTKEQNVNEKELLEFSNEKVYGDSSEDQSSKLTGSMDKNALDKAQFNICKNIEIEDKTETLTKDLENQQNEVKTTTAQSFENTHQYISCETVCEDVEIKGATTIEPDNVVSEALKNTEFVKYMELRQDQILDENRELTQTDLIKYLYKTWLYEEESKSDRQKIDELQSSTLVKGLQKDEPIVKPKRRAMKLNKNVKLESTSVRSDKNETTSKRSLRSRTNSPMETAMRPHTSSPCDILSKEKVAKVVLVKFTEDIIPEINKKELLEFSNIKDHGDSSEDQSSKLTVSVDTNELDKAQFNICKNKEIEDNTETVTKDLENQQSEVKTTTAQSFENSHQNTSCQTVCEDVEMKGVTTLQHENVVSEALKNTEFVKYMELRQDQILDEKPELTQTDLIKYLYKTWLYEEESKSDRPKIHELESSTLVKELQKDESIVKPKRRVNKLYNNVRLERMSVSSDNNETTSKRSLRSRTNCPMETAMRSQTSSSRDISSKEKVAKVVLAKFTEGIIPEINKKELLEFSNIKDHSDSSKDQSSELAVSIDTNALDNDQFNICKNKEIEDNTETVTKDLENQQSEVKTTTAQSFENSHQNTSCQTVCEDVEMKGITTLQHENVVSEALKNTEFVKYMELRQDQILDENPELTQTDLIKYLYKTWLYEEESKSDRPKIHELESSTLVKELQKDESIVKPKRRVNKLYNNVRLERMSVSSDNNETTSKRSLRSRTNCPMETAMRSQTSSSRGISSKEKVAKVVLAKFTEGLIPEINKKELLEFSNIKDHSDSSKDQSSELAVSIDTNALDNDQFDSCKNIEIEDNTETVTKYVENQQSEVKTTTAQSFENSHQNNSPETVCEDIELKDNTEIINNEVREKEEDSVEIDKTMNDLVNEIDCKKKTKDLQGQTFSVASENIVNQVNGHIGCESDNSKNHITLQRCSGEKTLLNKDFELSLHTYIKRKRFSLRRRNFKDNMYELKGKSTDNKTYTTEITCKNLQVTIEKNKEIDLYIQKSHNSYYVDRTNSVDQSHETILNKKENKHEEIPPNNFSPNSEKDLNNSADLKLTVKSLDLLCPEFESEVHKTQSEDSGNSATKEFLNNKNSNIFNNRALRSNKSEVYINRDIHKESSMDDMDSCKNKLDSAIITSEEIKHDESDLDFFEITPNSSKITSNKNNDSYDLNSSKKKPGSSRNKSKRHKVKNYITKDKDITSHEDRNDNSILNHLDSSDNKPSSPKNKLKQDKKQNKQINKINDSSVKDFCKINPKLPQITSEKSKHNDSSLNDLDTYKNKQNLPKITPESNIRENPSKEDFDALKNKPKISSENMNEVESAKAETVKLNITDVEVCISEGNIPRLTSPFEDTQKSDIYNKENSSDRFYDSESINSENSEIPLSKLSRKRLEDDLDTVSLNSNASSSSSRRSQRYKNKPTLEPENVVSEALENTEFVKYMELRQDQILDENPELTQTDLIKYLYKTWLYEEESKSDRQKIDEFESSTLVKGLQKDEPIVKPKRRVNKLYNNVRLESMSVSSDENETTSKRSLRSRTNSPMETAMRSHTSSPCDFPSKEKIAKVVLAKFTEDIIPDINKIHNEADKINPTDIQLINKDIDPEVASIDSENSDVPLILHKIHQEKLTTKLKAFHENVKEEVVQVETETKVDDNLDALSLKSEVITLKKITKRAKEVTKALDDPEFIKYLDLRQDNLMDEHPELTHDEIVQYLFKTWLYEESSKSESVKIDEIEQLNLVKGLNNEPLPQPKKIKKKNKNEKERIDTDEVAAKDKPKRRVAPACYNEEYFDLEDIEDEIQYFEIFKKKHKSTVNEPIKSETEFALDSSKIMSPKLEKEPIYTDISNTEIVPIEPKLDVVKTFDNAEIYFQNLTKPKPNVFRGMSRDKVCEICRKPSQLVKCKGCHEMFHVECVKKEVDMVDMRSSTKGRKKKKKPRRRKPKSANDSIESSSHSDEKCQGLNTSEDNFNISIEEYEPIVADAVSFEAQVAAKMKEIMDAQSNPYTPFKSNFQIDWATSNSGKCEIVDVKLVDTIEDIDYSDFKCNNCQKNDTPLCFVCKAPVSPKSGVETRQKCQLTHCHKYYHLECLDHWPQSQFSSGEMARNKKTLETYEAVTCPRHVCHTCVSDDPRGCKTRFSADKLARCVRCPATYHTFTKCLPAGTQILTGSNIICPRHYEHRPGKVPCHVNTGWCFICALGGILICCEYCPTSFHADCLKISPPEGGYMCEDCETGRLPLYGEMVWVKLGHYRWWPGLILHPSEVPANIMAVKHSPGEFVVRFFGQYDHYWVNRGRVFPFQEGDSGRISSQRSKIDAAFTMAMEHAQRACQILKNANLNQAELEDIASSLLPPAYVKLKVNKPCGSLIGRRVELEESSLTQCECDPNDIDPCGPNSSCLNRMLLTECGPTCRAGDRCQNRAFEKRQYPKLTPYRTPYRGWGLKTLEDIKMGQFVIEYVGELIDEEEFRRRMARMHDVRDENFYFLTLDKERMIDAGPKGNLARFMNHCCEPNCETQKWTVLADVRVGLFALRDIPAGSEVTFNYNFECAGIEKKRCLCGAKRCSGYIGAKPKQEEYQPKKPRINGVKRVYRKRKPEESPTITKTKVPKPRTTSRSKPKELTEIEKDLLIIKSATNGLSSDSEASGRLNSFDLESDKNQKLLKRKRVSFSTESEVILLNSDAKPPSVKRCKVESDKVNDVGD